MSESDLYQELAEITGESQEFLRQQGFSILGQNLVEERDDPLVIDWDEVDASRIFESFAI
jgi:hypothetical protein